MPYKIIREESFDALEKKVSHYVKIDWIPSGSATICNLNGKTIFVQSIYKPNKAKENVESKNLENKEIDSPVLKDRTENRILTGNIALLKEEFDNLLNNNREYIKIEADRIFAENYANTAKILEEKEGIMTSGASSRYLFLDNDNLFHLFKFNTGNTSFNRLCDAAFVYDSTDIKILEAMFIFAFKYKFQQADESIIKDVDIVFSEVAKQYDVAITVNEHYLQKKQGVTNDGV